MPDILRCISPVDGSVYAERPLAAREEAHGALARARVAQGEWRELPVETRAEVLSRAVDAFVADREAAATEVTWQMGRPVSQSPGEIAGFEERARHMIAIAPEALDDVVPPRSEGFTRFVRREPLGVVLVMAPWNYPYLTAVNAIVPALMAGNAVLLKHSAQTPLCAERLDAAFASAGLPAGLLTHLHLSHDAALGLIEAPDGVDFVAFTGSVTGGHAVQRAASARFIGVGLELGGKDPAYVRADADLGHAAENVIDGAFFNSGQSCCGIERIYVHASVHDEFLDRAVDIVEGYRLGDPLDPATTLGPVVRPAAAHLVREQCAEAVAAGARALVDRERFPAAQADGVYLAPQLLAGVDHTMRVMTEESFGPVAGVMPVTSDEEAVALMNDSAYGLTASVWTRDADAALALAERIETGTCFMNRCDYLDPALAWTGVKDSGRGCTLSRIGYESLTRPKSFHLRTGT